MAGKSRFRGKPNPRMESLAAQAEQVRARLIAAQQAAAQQEVSGASTNGAVQLVVTGDLTVRSVSVAPEAVADVSQLETDIAEAFASAVRAVNALRSGSTGGVDLEELNLGGVPLT